MLEAPRERTHLVQALAEHSYRRNRELLAKEAYNPAAWCAETLYQR
jgi:hypothetical protein